MTRTSQLAGALTIGIAIGAISTSVLMSRAQARGVARPAVAAHAIAPAVDAPHAAVSEPVVGTAGADGPAPIDPSIPSLTAGDGSLIDDLRARRLTIPVEGIDASRLVRSFEDARSGGRSHEAIDILAPRNTPVLAVEDGKIARLFSSKAGGITLYQYDPRERFVYYYAHLEAYAPGLKEGDTLKRGQVLGYVGTTGNAPPGTPHLHFAIFEMTERKTWWQGRPIDPFLVLR